MEQRILEFMRENGIAVLGAWRTICKKPMIISRKLQDIAAGPRKPRWEVARLDMKFYDRILI